MLGVVSRFPASSNSLVELNNIRLGRLQRKTERAHPGSSRFSFYFLTRLNLAQLEIRIGGRGVCKFQPARVREAEREREIKRERRRAV